MVEMSNMRRKRASVFVSKRQPAAFAGVWFSGYPFSVVYFCLVNTDGARKQVERVGRGKGSKTKRSGL